MTFHAHRFNRAAGTYARHSAIQEGMAGTLLELFPQADDPSPILEMGCGTGHFTRRIRSRFPRSHLLVTDASPRMLTEASQGLAGLAGPAPAGRSGFSARSLAVGDAVFARFDAEGRARLPAPLLAAAPFALAASNALVQWFPELGTHLALVQSLLAPGGCYLVSGFSRENFPELNAILTEEPLGYRNFPGHLAGDVEAAAAQAKLVVEAWREQSFEASFPSPEDFLSAIRRLGSSRRPEAGRPLTRGRLEHILRTYRERHSVPEGVKVTWKPWFALLRKA